MSDVTPVTSVRGVAVVDSAGKILFHMGIASDVRVRTMLSDAEWLRGL